MKISNYIIPLLIILSMQSCDSVKEIDYTNPYDQKGSVKATAPILNNIVIASASGSSIAITSSLSVSGNPQATVNAYIGYDGVINVTGSTVNGYVSGPIDVSGGSYTFSGLSQVSSYHIIVVAENIAGYSVMEKTQNTVGTGFNPGDGPQATADINQTVVQSDGKIIIFGNFSTYNGLYKNGLARINSDGSLDTSFHTGTGPDNLIQGAILQPDGKLIISGQFASYNGTRRPKFARINSDGSLDTTFTPGEGPDQPAVAIALQPDGKIIIGGNFVTYNGTSITRLARLNSDGTLDGSFLTVTGANSIINALLLQPDGKIVVGGGFTAYDGQTCNRIARVNSNGSIDTTFVPVSGANNTINTMALQSDGKILIGGLFTTYDGAARQYVARVNANGTNDTTFVPAPGANATVTNVTLQGNGKILINGSFTTYNGTTRNYLARINNDGSLDSSLDPGSGADNTISSIALQSDGKIIICGLFSNFTSIARNKIARVNSDSSLDTTFDPGVGVKLNGAITGIAVQTDGKYLIVGDFISYNGTTRNYLARVNTDGSLDTTFNPGAGANGTINAIAIQADGKIIIGGSFSTYDGTSRPYLARVNSNGGIDATFATGSGPNATILALAIQGDGKILIGGNFTTYDGAGNSRNRIARLNADGTLDTTFTPGTGAGSSVNTMIIQGDGKIIIGGFFTTYTGTARNRLARLNADGTLDTTFTIGTGADSTVLFLALQTDGKVVIGGVFTIYDGVSRNGIARINTDGTLDTTFNTGTGIDNRIFAMAIQSDQKILIGGSFMTFNGFTAIKICRLNANGTLDTAFNSGTSADFRLSGMTYQSDGKIIIAGRFTYYNGVVRRGMARISSDGSTTQ